MNSERIEWIDEVKGLCMLLIIISHSVSFQGCEFFYSAYILPFFFVSGFTSKFPNINLLKRSRRLLIPYFFYSLVYLLIYTIKDRNVWDLVRNCIGVLYARSWIFRDVTYFENIRFDIALWFLPTMFISYVILKLFKNVGFWSSSIILLFSSYLLTYLPVLLPWGLDIAPLCAWFILLGFNFKRFMGGHVPFLYVILSLSFYVFLVWINGSINLSISKFGQNFCASYFVCILINLLFTAILVVIFRQYSGKLLFKKILLYFGTHSLRLYCLNLFGIIVANILVPQFKIQIIDVNNILRLFVVLISIYVADRFLNSFSAKSNFVIFKYI